MADETTTTTTLDFYFCRTLDDARAERDTDAEQAVAELADKVLEASR